MRQHGEKSSFGLTFSGLTHVIERRFQSEDHVPDSANTKSLPHAQHLRRLMLRELSKPRCDRQWHGQLSLHRGQASTQAESTKARKKPTTTVIIGLGERGGFWRTGFGFGGGSTGSLKSLEHPRSQPATSASLALHLVEAGHAHRDCRNKP